MLPLWMAYATLFSAIVAGIAIVADHVAGIWNLPRRFVWISALVLVVFVPPALAFRPRPHAVSESSGVRRVHIEWPTTVRAPYQREAVRVDSHPVIRDWSRLAATGWLSLSVVLLALLIRDFALVRRRKSSWKPATLDGKSVLIGDDVGPAVVGALRSSIVVPAWAVDLDAESRALMLCHEAEHIRAGDPRVLLAAAIALALVPWNAALWLIVRRLRLAVEIDCDARVLRAFGRPREYGMLLITVGARHSLSLPLAASLAEERPLLERRIVAMTMSRPSRPLVASLPFGLLVVAAGGLLAQTPLPAPMVTSSGAITSRELGSRKLMTSLALTTAPSSGAASESSLTAITRDSVRRVAGGEPRITAVWVDAPLNLVLDAFSKYANRAIAATDAIGGKMITANVTNEPWDSALRRIVSDAGLSMRATADSIVIDAAPKGPIPIDTVTAWILVHHQDAFRATGSDLRITIVVDENDHYVTSELDHVTRDQPRALSNIVKDKDIENVEVLKGAAAATAYGKAAENGVIVIRTKDANRIDPITGTPAMTGDSVIVRANAERQKTLMASIEARSASSLGNRSPLYIVDGVVVPDLNGAQASASPLTDLHIDPNTIASVDVLKFPAGKITPDALGVILVKLKAK